MSQFDMGASLNSIAVTKRSAKLNREGIEATGLNDVSEQQTWLRLFAGTKPASSAGI
jgi:hypothetical protein